MYRKWRNKQENTNFLNKKTKGQDEYEKQMFFSLRGAGGNNCVELKHFSLFKKYI